MLTQRGNAVITLKAEHHGSEATIKAISVYFESAVGIDDVESSETSILAEGMRIVVAGAMHESVYVYAADGRCTHMVADATGTVAFTMDATGVYLVKIGERAAQRVVVMR